MHAATIKLIAASFISTTIGVAAGAYATKRILGKRYDDEMQEELDTIRLYYRNKAKYPSPKEAAAALLPKDEIPETAIEDSTVPENVKAAVAMYQGQPVNVTAGAPTGTDVTPDPDEVEVIEDFPEPMNETHSVFVNGEPINPDDFDPDEEALARKNGVPYVITQTDLDVNEFNHEHVILTWFAGGDEETLVDDDEKPIDDVENTVGRDNLDKFGRGSGDPRVVYIRNEARGVDYEVMLDHGSYMEKVLGITEDDDDFMQHSSTPRRRQRLVD